ncbi:MAG TPA: hypothetical protein VN648_14685, partial [Candidatus Methylomirabilis sp.]|nr:hypothetical protein [Candidatus Methylomirabilis sp.]
MRRRFPVLGVVLVLIGAAGLAWLSAFEGGSWRAGGFFMGPGMMGGGPPAWYGKKGFTSNGEQIYYTGISAKTGPIPFVGGPMWL